MADVANTSKLIIPQTYVPTIFDKVRQNAVIPALTTQTPRLYENTDVIYITEKPVAEYVDEGGAKGSSGFGFGHKPMVKFKLHSTIRMTEEVQWADEDGKLYLIDKVLDENSEAIGVGVDAGMIHAWNPGKAAALDKANDIAIAKVGTEVSPEATTQETIDALPDKVIEAGFNPNGIALDTMFANELRKSRNANTGARQFPDIPLSLEVGNFEGLRAVTSGNVSGRSIPGMTDTGIKAIIGDWSMFQWGIIREIGLRRFDVGDPDGKGYDLSHNNEIAYRVELVFAAGIVFADAFAFLKGEPYSTMAAKAAVKVTK